MADAKTDDTSVRYDDVTGRKSDILAAIESVGAETVDAPTPKTAAVAAEVIPDAQLGEQQPNPTKTASELVAELVVEPPEGEKTEPQEPKGVEPSANWKKADKEAFATLPDEAKALVLRLESSRTADYTRKTMENADFRKEYGAIDEMFSPFKEQMKASNYSPYTIVQAWMNTERALMGGRGADVIKDIAKAYNIDLRSVAGVTEQPLATKRPEDMSDAERAQAEIDGLVKPYLTPMQKQIEELSAWRTAREQSDQTLQQREQAMAVQRAQKTISDFASEADDKGIPAHPHFQAVEQQMGMLALSYKNMGQAVPPLKDLYETTCLSNPTIKTEMETSRAASILSSQREVARAKAVQATKAAKSVTGAPGGNPPKANGVDHSQASIRQLLESAMEESGAR